MNEMYHLFLNSQKIFNQKKSFKNSFSLDRIKLKVIMEKPIKFHSYIQAVSLYPYISL